MKRTKKRRKLAFRSSEDSARLTAADRRRIAREQVEDEFPILAKKIAEIRAGLIVNLAKGRYGYRASLLDIYMLAWKWADEDRFAARVATVATLSGRLHRKGANPFSAIIAAVTDRDSRTISRWSQELARALKQDVPPKKLLNYLNKPVR